MTTRASKEASRLAKHNTSPHSPKSTEDLVEQDSPHTPVLKLVSFKTITVDKHSAEQIKAIYQAQVCEKAS